MSITLDIEYRIIGKLVDDALAAGHYISVNDGEETVVTKSNSRKLIISAMRSTDEDVLSIFTATGDYLGRVWLIYGNGCDVISDYSDRETMTALLAGANSLAEQLT